MIYRTPQKEIDAYFDDTEHLSQSKVKKILQGMDAYNKDSDEHKLYYEEKGHFTIGNGVDVMLTQGETTFNKKFHIMTVDKPTGKLMSIIQYLFDRIVEGDNGISITSLNMSLHVSDDDILTACDTEEFQPRWGDSAKIKSVRANGSDYFDELCLSFGRQLVSPDEKNTIDSIVNSLKENEVTNIFFPEECPEHIDIYYQYPIYGEIDGVKCKALLDVVRIDRNIQQIQVADLKTTGEYTINFSRAAMRMRYDIQACFYSDMLHRSNLIEDDYSILPFIFIVESTLVQGNSLIYRCTEDFLSMGIFGRPEGYTELIGKSIVEGRKNVYHSPIYGYAEGIDRYKWHLIHGFEKDKIVVENNGVIHLSWNKIE